MEKLEIRNEIVIAANANTVWNVLTNSEYTKKYMFGCETISDWKQGSELLWRGEYEGKAMIFVKGKIREIRNHEFLAYTTFDPNHPSMKDVPENYLTVTYTLKPEGNHTLLIVTQGDYNTVEEGQKRYEESYSGGSGWMPVLEQIKTLAEMLEED